MLSLTIRTAECSLFLPVSPLAATRARTGGPAERRRREVGAEDRRDPDRDQVAGREGDGVRRVGTELVGAVAGDGATERRWGRVVILHEREGPGGPCADREVDGDVEVGD